ncbi:hypothetical protein DL766_010488 [Monosporascus sp. MC13-8B]|nr:hypothetical protein DL763_008187 [Monosporascus cannonballus]RYP02206.1 hypothetical protein DL766_010488 [Monosporascus sp. MC13-8B]
MRLAEFLLRSLPCAVVRLAFVTRARASGDETVEPVAVKVASESIAGTPYFEYERQQLTDQSLERIHDDPDASEYADLFGFGSGVSTGNRPSSRPTKCRVFPGDEDWPSERKWKIFNKLLGNALIPTTPLAAPEDDPTSVMWPIWQGRTCLPRANKGAENETCALGAYPVAAVNVTNVAQIQLAINFARNANLRLVIKNTGHCFLGKSSGAGALSIWLHNLDEIKFLPDYSGPGYSGKAIKVGPSVTVKEAFEFAHEHDVSVLGGIAESVGFGGGYLQGGGHTPLSGLYGMAADHIMALEVVTADGRFLTASPTSHSDLYWALCGGGGGTFGVVTSTIVRVQPKLPVTTSFFSFGTSSNVSTDVFFEGLRAYFERFIPFTDAHTYGYFYIIPSNGSYRFEMVPFFAPNHTIASFNALTKPLFDRLSSLGIPVAPRTRHYAAFYPASLESWTQGPVGSYVMPANRLIPRANFEDPERFDRTLAVLRAHLEAGRNVVGYHQAPRNRARADNAVSSAWRAAAAFLISEVTAPAGAGPAELRELSRRLDEDVMGPWRDVAPAAEGGGVYLNEAHPMEGNWQREFYGEQYARLLRIKRRWDPRDVFYVTTGVGSEGWEVRSQEADGVLTQNGRLCRVE